MNSIRVHPAVAIGAIAIVLILVVGFFWKSQNPGRIGPPIGTSLTPPPNAGGGNPSAARP